jgi:hypothetical protein
LDRAEAALADLLTRARRDVGKRDVLTLSIWMELVHLQYIDPLRAFATDDAVDQLRGLLAAARRGLGRDHEMVLQSWRYLIEVLWTGGRYDEADNELSAYRKSYPFSDEDKQRIDELRKDLALIREHAATDEETVRQARNGEASERA